MSMSTGRSGFLTGALLFFSLAALPLPGWALCYAFVNIGITGVDDTDPSFASISTHGLNFDSASGYFGLADASAYASVGTLGLGIHAQAHGKQAGGDARCSFTDSITFSSPNLAIGTPIDFTFSHTVHYSSPIPTSSIYGYVDGGVSISTTVWFGVSDNTNMQGIAPPGEGQSFSQVSSVYHSRIGDTLKIDTSLYGNLIMNAYVNQQSNSTLEYSLDATHTAHTYINVLTPQVTVISASGHDYSPAAAAPEPVSLSLVGLGYLILCGVLGRRKRCARLPFGPGAVHCSLALLAVLHSTSGANAQDLYITTDTTIDSAVSAASIFVGKDNASSFTTLPGTITLSVEGASDGSSGAHIDATVQMYGNHRTNLTGGYLDATYGWDSGVLSMSNGVLGIAWGHDHSTFMISGGVVLGGTVNEDDSVLNVTGGDIANVQSYGTSVVNINGGILTHTPTYGFDSSTLNITGGSFNDIAVSNTSTANISGGTVENVVADEFSTVNYFGGDSVGGTYGSGHSTVNILGGTSPMASGSNNSTFNISGGSITQLSGFDASIFNLTGGNINSNRICLYGNSVLNLYGTGLTLTLTGQGSDGIADFLVYTLTGVLQKGQRIDGVQLIDYLDGGFNIKDSGNPNTPNSPVRFFVVNATAPEPASASLCVMLFFLVTGGIIRRHAVRFLAC